ncbi:MAG TPA: 16S rRNA (adenine(1518)-N(6)/adenine(1519)-N(6))-dimethyltransferase RsmA [Planctomycetaceae bacterium]
MSDAKRQTRTHLMGLFEKIGLHPRSDLGQNFLIDLNILEYVVKSAELSKRDVVLEVGAGTGGMTAFMAKEAAAVVSVEVDRNMAAMAREAVAGFDNVTLVNVDALKSKNRFRPEVVDALRAELAKRPDRRLKLVANLPYSIATPVVSNLVASDLPWERMVVTIQLELAQRMVAGPGKSNYGALSVWLQSQCHVKLLKRLPPAVFWPRPQVNSAIVQLVPAPNKAGGIADRPFFQDFLRRLFAHRRKFMRGVIVGMYRRQLDKPEIDAILDDLGFGLKARAEELEPYQLVKLANRLHAAVAEKGSREPSAQSGDEEEE